MARLPIIQLNKRYYYRDERLKQLRAVDNYLDSMEWTDLISAVGLGGFDLIWEMPESFPSDEVLSKAANPENMGLFSIREDVVQHVDQWLEKLPESDQTFDKDTPPENRGTTSALQDLLRHCKKGHEKESDQEQDREQEP